MRLSLKIISLFFVCFLVLLGVDSALLIRRDMRVLDQRIHADAGHLGRVYGELLHHIVAQGEVEDAVRLVHSLDQQEADMRLRWVWLDALPPSLHAPLPGVGGLDGLAIGETLSFRKAVEDGADQLAVYVPLHLRGEREAALELTESLRPAEEFQGLILRRSLLLVVVMALMGLLLSWLILVPLVGRPLQTMLQMTRRIGAGDFTCQLHLPGRSELTDLALAMNSMCGDLETARVSLEAESEARLEALDQLRHAERLAMLGRIASGLAHELGTPLNVVAGRAKMIGSGDLKPDEVGKSARIIREQAERMTGIIRQLLDFARRPRSQFQVQSLEPIVEAVVQMLTPTARTAGVELIIEKSDSVPGARVDRNQLEQVVLNLVMNAIQAMPDGGRVRLGLETASEAVTLLVADDGLGMDASQQEQIFEPFFTTKAAGEGTGLGLSIVKGIVEEHGGRISVQSAPAAGTTFTIELPGEGEA